MISKNDLLQMVTMDDTAQKVFLSMSQGDQMLAILGMLSYLRESSANNTKKLIELTTQFNDYKQSQNEYRQLREQEEQRIGNLIRSMITGDGLETKKLSPEELMTTTQKIAKALASRFDFWVWVRDKVLPQIVTVIILAILALIFTREMVP